MKINTTGVGNNLFWKVVDAKRLAALKNSASG